ncbi:hypothetical protein THAOC_34406, partial [Thalassiosira oceanica]
GCEPRAKRQAERKQPKAGLRSVLYAACAFEGQTRTAVDSRVNRNPPRLPTERFCGICKLLNAGKGEQFVQPGADEWTEQHDIDALHYVAAMHQYPKPSADMYILFKGASRGDTKRQVAARAKKMRDLARVLISKNKFDAVHQIFYRTMQIMLRDEPWRVEQPYSPILALLQSGLDLSMQEDSSANFLYSLSQSSSATSTSRNRNQVTIGRQLLEIGGADPNLFCGRGQAFPLFDACYSNQPTNLEFIELLLEHGADRNMECPGGTAIVGAFDMSLDAIKLLITYEHANCPPIDINKRHFPGFNATALDFTRINIVKFTRFRDEVAITGKTATNCYKTWTTVEPFNVQIEKLKELEELLLSKGAVEGDVETSQYELHVKQPDRMPRKDGLQVLEAYHMLVGCLDKEVEESHAKLPFDVSCLFGIEDLIRGKRSPNWYSENPAHITDASTRMLQAFEGRPHLHCSHYGAPKVGLKVKLYLSLPNKTRACLAGQVTEALPVPTEKELKRTKRTADPTHLYKRPCPVPFCKHGVDECWYTRTGSYGELLQKFGAVHGQEVKCRLKFTQNMFDGRDESVVAFFAGYSKFDVTLHSKMDDLRPELDVTSNTLLVRPLLAKASLLLAVSLLLFSALRRFETIDLIILTKNSDASIVFSAMTHASDSGRLLHHLSAASLITKQVLAKVPCRQREDGAEYRGQHAPPSVEVLHLHGSQPLLLHRRRGVLPGLHLVPEGYQRQAGSYRGCVEHRREDRPKEDVLSQDNATNEEVVADEKSDERADTVDQAGVRPEEAFVDPEEPVLGPHDEIKECLRPNLPLSAAAAAEGDASPSFFLHTSSTSSSSSSTSLDAYHTHATQTARDGKTTQRKTVSFVRGRGREHHQNQKELPPAVMVGPMDEDLIRQLHELDSGLMRSSFDSATARSGVAMAAEEEVGPGVIRSSPVFAPRLIEMTADERAEKSRQTVIDRLTAGDGGVSDYDVERNLREIRGILSTNQEILNRSKDSVYPGSNGFETGSPTEVTFKRISYNEVTVTSGDIFSWEPTPTSTYLVTFTAKQVFSRNAFDLAPLGELPKCLRDIIVPETKPLIFSHGQRHTAIDFESVIDRALLLHEDVQGPALSAIKRQLMDIQVLLGSIESWIIEGSSGMHFINETFGVDLSEKFDGGVQTGVGGVERVIKAKQSGISMTATFDVSVEMDRERLKRILELIDL